jgi:hypothetical protein
MLARSGRLPTSGSYAFEVKIFGNEQAPPLQDGASISVT